MLIYNLYHIILYYVNIYVYIHIHIYIHIYLSLYSRPQKDRTVFLGFYSLETGRIKSSQNPRNRKEKIDPNVGEKFRQKNHANMEDPRTYAESTNRWGMLKIEKPK